jgi:hypothetical protein
MESHMNREVLEATVPAAGAAVTQDQVVGRSPITGRVSYVVLVPEAALVANATNFRTFRILNRGQAGAGSAVVATFATDTPATDDLQAFNDRVIPLTAAVDVAQGDVLAVDETVAGTGVAHSGYKVSVELTR